MSTTTGTVISIFDGTEVEINFAKSTSLRLVDGVLHRTCSACHHSKPATPDFFPNNKTDRVKIGAVCNVCALARTRSYKAANTKHYLATIRECAARQFKGKGLINRFQTFGKTTVIFCRKPSDDTVVRCLIDTADLAMIQKIDAEWLANDEGYIWTPSPWSPRPTMHSLIMGTPRGRVTDHISGRRHDNRRFNLRVVSSSDNGLNRISQSPRNRSGYRGVFWSKREHRWRAQIVVSRKPNYLGSYRQENFTEACQAVHDFLIKLKVPNVRPIPTQSLAVAA